MNRRFMFDNCHKCAVISDHGKYRMYYTAINTDKHIVCGEMIQEGSTDEMGFIYNYVGDTLFLDPSGFSTEEVERRLSAVCGKTEPERLQMMQQERAACAEVHFGIKLAGDDWLSLDVFEG